MHIVFKNIKIKNFMSIGYGEVDLDNQGYVSINGINNNKDDNAKSNGSGKSAIIESIVFCLTGETIRGTKDIVNRYEADLTKSYEYSADDKTFIISANKEVEFNVLTPKVVDHNEVGAPVYNSYEVNTLAPKTMKNDETEALEKNTEEKVKAAEQSGEQAKAMQEEYDSLKELTNEYKEALKTYEETGEGKASLMEKAIELADAMGIENASLLILKGDYEALNAEIEKNLLLKAQENAKS
jgi:hypothetical protein